MDPAILMPMLYALPAPIVFSLAVLLGAWWMVREGARPAFTTRLAGVGPLWAGGAAIAGAVLVGGLIRMGPGELIKPQFATWPVIAAATGLVFGLLERRWEGVAHLVWPLRALLVMGLVTAIARPLLGEWSNLERAAWILGFPALVLASWFGLDRALARPGPTGPLLGWTVATFTAIARFATGSATGGEIGAWLACGFGSALVAALVLRGRGFTLAGPAGVGAMLVLASLWFLGVNSSSLRPEHMILLASGPIVGLLADLDPLGRLDGWKHAIVRAGLAAIPAIIALGVILPKAAADAAAPGY